MFFRLCEMLISECDEIARTVDKLKARLKENSSVLVVNDNKRQNSRFSQKHDFGSY